MDTDSTFPIPSTSTRPYVRPATRPPLPPPPKLYATGAVRPWCKMLSFLRVTPDPNKWMALWRTRVPPITPTELGNMEDDVPWKTGKDEESAKISNRGDTRRTRAYSQPAWESPKKRVPSVWRSSRYPRAGGERYSDSSESSSDSDDSPSRTATGRRTREKRSAHSWTKYAPKTRFRGRGFQIYSVVACSVTLFTSGMQSGWSVLVLSQDMDEGDWGRFQLGINERAMVLGAFYIAVFVSSPPTGLLMDFLGRKTVLLLSTLPSVSAWIQAITATTAKELFLSRFVAGLACGIAYTAAPIYVGEISEAHLRGTFSVLLSVTLVAGMLVNVAMIPIATFQIPIAIGMASSLLFFIMLILASESPTHYIFKGDMERAHLVLLRIRGKNDPKVFEEFNTMIQCADSVKRIGLGFQDVCGRAPNKRAFHALMLLVILQQFGGICVFENNIHGIFDRKYSVMTVQHAAVTFKSVQVCTTIVGMLLVDRWGRRPLLLVSCAGLTLTLFVLCINFLVLEKWHEGNEVTTSWIAAILCPIYAAFFGFGIGPIPWVLLGEMFPPVLRGTAACGICLVTNFCGFVSMKLFQELQEYYSLDAALWSSAMACIVATVFVWFVIPETARRNINDIIDDLAEE